MWNVSLEPSNRKFFRIKKFESQAFQEQVNHSCLGEGECHHLNKILTKNSKMRLITYSFREFFWKQRLSHLKFSHWYRNHSIKPQMLTITVNKFENTDPKFHNHQTVYVFILMLTDFKTAWGKALTHKRVVFHSLQPCFYVLLIV